MATPLTGVGSIGTNTPINTVPLLTAGIDGALVTRITALPRATVADTGLQLYLRRATDAVDVRHLIDAETMVAYGLAASTTPKATVFSLYNEGTPLRLAAGDELHVGAAVALAGGICFRAEYTDF